MEITAASRTSVQAKPEELKPKKVDETPPKEPEVRKAAEDQKSSTSKLDLTA